MDDYQQFLKAKHARVEACGFDVNPDAINPMLFPFQRDIVRWALKLGRAAVFAECGLGKTPIQLEVARHIVERTGGRVVILAPLAVAHQTVREGVKFGVTVKFAHNSDEIGDHKIIVTNYQKLHLFDTSAFVGVILDESSILKNFTGATKRKLVETFAETPFRYGFTATPAPNDYLEFGNHAEFLGVMPSNEMIARWFINDTMKAGAYRLKGHAEADFWRWLTSWAVSISEPRDLGDAYHMDSFKLPPLRMLEHHLQANDAAIERAWGEGRLLPDVAVSSTGLHAVKRESLADRVAKAREIYDAIPDDEPVIIWCDTNYEADALKVAFPDAIEVRGDHSDAQKEELLNRFSDGGVRTIIVKPEIAGFGLNWQHCAHEIFVGVSFSFEKTYQALRRCWRFGQTKEVHAHLIYAETEGNVLETLRGKQEAFKIMQSSMNAAMREHGLFRDGQRAELSVPKQDVARGRNWTMHLGDCVPTTAAMPDNHIHMSVYSPPFGSLYIYSDSEADMGNARSSEEFFAHYEYLIKELYRVTMPGRLTAVHVKDLPIYKNAAGWFGIEDFSGLVSVLHRRHGWVFHSRVTIWKDPVTEMEKTNSHGLLHKNFANRAQVVRTGLPDYLMVFAKPDPEGMGEDVKQLRTPGDFIGTNAPAPHEYLNSLRQRKPSWYPGAVDQYNYSIAVWQRYASPVWFDIDQTDVLNYKIARSDKDEKHIAPLQLGVSKRAIDLWSNPGELVYSPFGGIGSEGHSALLLGRRFEGVELKPEYHAHAVANLKEAEAQAERPTLFDWMEANNAAD